MAHLDPAHFQRSIADTVAWCRIKAIGLDANDGEVKRRQALYAHAEQLWNEAIKLGEQRGFRPGITGTKQYQYATGLMNEIRAALGPMDRSLRSPELKPGFGLDQFGNDRLWTEAVEEVNTKRARLVPSSVAGQSTNNVGGRLLLYRPSENLACGAADFSSNGFFDMNNVPPWDIWVGFSGGTLVSWVPPTLVDVAQMGVYVNPEECIGWAE